jgi:hypothetical protein
MARRPFFSSLSLVSSLRMPMGSKGKEPSTPVCVFGGGVKEGEGERECQHFCQ